MARTPSTESTPRRKRWNRWINRILLLLFVGLLVAPGIWGYRAQSRLDALLAEYRSRGEPAALADLRGLIVPDEQNGVIELRAAAKLIDEHDKDLDALDELALPLTDEEMRLITQVVERYRPAIDGVRRAAQKTAFGWQVQWQSPMVGMPPDVNEQRRLARLVRAAAMVSHQRGREREATGHLNDCLFIARALSEHRGLVAELASNGIAASALQTMMALAPTLSIQDADLSRQQAKVLIQSLLEQDSGKPTLRRALLDERVAVLDHAACLIEGRPIPGQPAGIGAWQWPMRYAAKPLLLDEARLVLQHLTHAANSLDLPNWPAFQSRVPDRPEAVRRHPRLHLIASSLTAIVHPVAGRHYRIIAERRMAAIALAIRLWSLEHDGRLPASLDELVPACLPAIPLDPFSASGGVILYKPDPDRPILYSVGQNGADDGGLVTHSNRGMWAQPDAVVHLKQQPRREPEPDAVP